MRVAQGSKRTPQEVFRQALQERNLKLTRQRQVILDFLLNMTQHMSAEEMYLEISQLDRTLGRATVFRTLRILEESGIASKIMFANGTQAYEVKLSRPHHDHMICVDCKTVIEFSSEKIEAIQEQIAKKYQFFPLWHRHEIFGRCKLCAKKN